MDLTTQLWSMNKETWNLTPFLAPKLTSQFGFIDGFGCSTAVNSSVVVFIGGHYMDVRLKPGAKGLVFSDYKQASSLPSGPPFNLKIYYLATSARAWIFLVVTHFTFL